ncbi:MAG: hypothetical protein ACI8W1_003159 [Candidatus Azotimanducaceae bacterium]|jgi:hypothetical protein
MASLDEAPQRLRCFFFGGARTAKIFLRLSPAFRFLQLILQPHSFEPKLPNDQCTHIFILFKRVINVLSTIFLNILISFISLVSDQKMAGSTWLNTVEFIQRQPIINCRQARILSTQSAGIRPSVGTETDESPSLPSLYSLTTSSAWIVQLNGIQSERTLDIFTFLDKGIDVYEQFTNHR